MPLRNVCGLNLSNSIKLVSLLVLQEESLKNAERKLPSGEEEVFELVYNIICD